MPSSRAHIDLFTHFYSVCPGIPFAERTVWIEIAMLLWTFNIRKAKEPSAETGLPFTYDDSDAAFTGDVRVYHRC